MQLDPEIERLSPIHNRHQVLGARFALQAGWLIPEVYTASDEEATILRESVALVDISARGKLIIKGADVDGIFTAHFGKSPTKLGDVIEIETTHLLIAKLTSDEFLILTLPGSEQESITSLEAEITSKNIFVSVIDQTSGLVGLSISGLESTRMMRKLCALDFDPTEFPNLHVAQSSFAKIRTTIIRHDQGSSPAYELFADCSYADYLWDTILDAGLEFGIQPVGWEALRGRNT